MCLLGCLLDCLLVRWFVRSFIRLRLIVVSLSACLFLYVVCMVVVLCISCDCVCVCVSGCVLRFCMIMRANLCYSAVRSCVREFVPMSVVIVYLFVCFSVACLFVFLLVCMFGCLSSLIACLQVGLCISLVALFGRVRVSWSVLLCVCRSDCLMFCLLDGLSVCLPICVSLVCLFFCLFAACLPACFYVLDCVTVCLLVCWFACFDFVGPVCLSVCVSGPACLCVCLQANTGQKEQQHCGGLLCTARLSGATSSALVCRPGLHSCTVQGALHQSASDAQVGI